MPAHVIVYQRASLQEEAANHEWSSFERISFCFNPSQMSMTFTGLASEFRGRRSVNVSVSFMGPANPVMSTDVSDQ
jgi:hypothetical protein